MEAACRRSSKDTLICGKPSASFFQACLDSLRQEYQGKDVNADEMIEERNIIIGDDIEADLGNGAIDLGLERVLGEC